MSLELRGVHWAGVLQGVQEAGLEGLRFPRGHRSPPGPE